MKSYSNDIPNVSTDDIKRNAEVNEETNNLVKENLTAIVNHDSNTLMGLQSIQNRINLIILLAALSLVSSAGALVLAALPYFTNG